MEVELKYLLMIARILIEKFKLQCTLNQIYQNGQFFAKARIKKRAKSSFKLFKIVLSNTIILWHHQKLSILMDGDLMIGDNK